MYARTRQHDVAQLTEAAMAVALSIALGNLRLLHLPNGGSIEFGMVPLLLLATVRGFRPAFAAGWCAGLGHALLGGTVVHPIQYLLDYGLAFAVLAAASLARGRSPNRLRLAVALACAAQYGVFVVSGAVFFAAYAGASDPWAYSLGYNAITSAPEAVLTMWALPIVVRAWARANPVEGLELGLVVMPGTGTASSGTNPSALQTTPLRHGS